MSLFQQEQQSNKELEGYIIITEEGSGLGFAKMLADEERPVILAKQPNEPDEGASSEEVEKHYDFMSTLGLGMVETDDFASVLAERNKYKKWGWLWDGNHNSDQADRLRKEGFMVRGTYAFTKKMERDRKFAEELVKKAGLNAPPTFEFQTVEDGIAFLESYEDTAFVLKPDEPDDKGWSTTDPDSNDNHEANQEIIRYLEALGEAKSPYILQERKKGVEVNVEYFVHDGKAYFSHANFEVKKKYGRDQGVYTGCSFDMEFLTPLHCSINEDTLAKLLALPEFRGYSGPLDLNLIAADRKYWFLEFCCRLGYNAHPNLFINLGISPFGKILDDIFLGRTENFERHFRQGFGAAITMRTEYPTKGMPLDIPKKIDEKFYHFNAYRENEAYYMAGNSQEIGIVCGHDYDTKSAADEVLKNFEKIHYPGRWGRMDIDLENYDSNIHERYKAAEAMRLFTDPRGV